MHSIPGIGLLVSLLSLFTKMPVFDTVNQLYIQRTLWRSSKCGTLPNYQLLFIKLNSATVLELRDGSLQKESR